MAHVYFQLYSRLLRMDIQGDFSDTAVHGKELTKTLALLDRGGLSPAEQLYFAMEGWGTDEAAIRRTLANRSLTEINQIRTAYVALSGGQTLDSALSSELGGRDLFDAQQAMLGRPETLEANLQRLRDLHAYERPGGLSGLGDSSPVSRATADTWTTPWPGRTTGISKRSKMK